MKKKYIFIICIELLILVLVAIPIAINELYKVGEGYHTVWNGADMLSYYGSVVCSLMAALISIFTLIEMKVQRDKAYQPNVTFDNTRIIIDTGIKKIDKQFVTRSGFVPAGENWDVNNNTVIENIDFSKTEYYLSTGIYNTGVGVCKYFSCKFSHHSYLTWTEAYEKFDLIKRESVSHAENESSYIPKSKSRNLYTHPFAKDKSDTVVSEPFLLPNAEKRYRLKLPFEYLRFLMLAIDIDDFDKLKSNGLPSIDIEMQYSDVQGKTYKQAAQIKITAFSATVSSKGTLQYIYDVSANENA